MFAPVHTTSSSAGQKYGVNGSSSKGYGGGSTVPARFSVHVFQKPGFGSYYPPANNVNNMKMDAVGYRPSIPQPPYNAAPRYDDRYAVPHPHAAAVPPPRLNTGTPSNLSRNYDPKAVPVSVPAPPSARSRAVPNFSIYPSNAQDTFIYEQSQGSKSDLLSTSDFDSASSPTESISSTVTLRGADTPGTETSSLEPSPVEPSMSRRDSLMFNGAQSPGLGMGADFHSRPPIPGGRPAAGPAFPPHMTAAMLRTPSESSIDVRERIATVNAQINSASTASYYTPSPSSSVELGVPGGPQMTPAPASQGTPQRGQHQPIFADTYIHSSPEHVHTHSQPQQPLAGGRSRSTSPPQPQQSYPDQSSSRHEQRRSSPPNSQQSRPSSTYGPPSSQMRRSPSQQQSSSSPPTYPPADDYFSPTTPSSGSRSHQQYSPNSGYTTSKHTSSSSPPRDEPQRYADHQDRRQSSASPPSMTRQTSSYANMDRVRSTNDSGSNTPNGAGHHHRYSPQADTSIRSAPSLAPSEDEYARERDSVPRRERRRSVSYAPGDVMPPVSYSSSSGSGSSTSTATPGQEYSSSRERERDRDRDRDRDRRDRDRDRDRSDRSDRDRDRSDRDRDRSDNSRRSSVYNPDQQQSTIPFSRSSPPSPPSTTLKYSAAPVTNEPSRQSSSYSSSSSSSSPERMARSRSRTSSMSNGVSSSRPTVPELSMSTLHISTDRDDPISSSRGPRHPDLAPSHGFGAPISASSAAPAASSIPLFAPEADTVSGSGVYRRRRMSVISQVSDAGSMAAMAAGSIPMGGPPPGVSYSDPHGQRSSADMHHPTPQRRLSDGDRPVSSVRYELKQQQASVAQGQQAAGYRAHPEPQRRYSDGDQKQPHPSLKGQSQSGSHYYHQQREQEQQAAAAAAAFAARNVRWDENLICPSPILPAQKRKGWYNRRGDQLWTNDGMFRPCPAEQQYPGDLDDYPEHGEGWMNEDGVRIDMEHRRVPKMPRRSALKPSGGRN